ncbi:MAG: sulfotransferase domain-containing protein [Chloroflexi bacterium]|nr:sulfotransferase domain-containing protein [Chloroflexota bacterium]
MAKNAKADSSERIVVVSGLPRSGTSLMMQMLEAGGIAPLTDHERVADDDNPKGYYEFERAKKLREGDTVWLQEAKGKAVKIISALVTSLPEDYSYDVILMRRDMSEVLASQRKMLLRRGECADKLSDDMMGLAFEKHLNEVFEWMNQQNTLRYIEVNFNKLITDPLHAIERLGEFLARALNREDMKFLIAPELYRQRKDKAI